MSDCAWFLTGSLDADEPVRSIPICSANFLVGRSRGCDLRLASNAVSSRHAIIMRKPNGLVIRDLNSRNGVYVNGIQIDNDVFLEDADRIEIGDLVFRVSATPLDDQESGAQTTWDESGCQTAQALAGLEQLIASRRIVCLYEPLVRLSDRTVFGHQLHETSQEPGLKTLPEMLLAANQLSLECELGNMLRHAGLTAACAGGGRPNLFISLYPRENIDFRTARTLCALRKHFPKAGIVLQICESVAAELHTLKFFCEVLHSSNIQVGFTQFGSGRSRLFEMCHVQPDYLMFDRSMVFNLKSKSKEELNMLGKLVQLAKEMGITTAADCVHSQHDLDACASIGFDLGKGSYLGEPVTAEKAGFVSFDARDQDSDNITTSLRIELESSKAH